MKQKIIYQCEYCLTEYKTHKEAFKCEAELNADGMPMGIEVELIEGEEEQE